MKQQLMSFIVRWVFNTIGLWVTVALFGTGYEQVPEGFFVFLLAGMIFSIVNAWLRPIAVILSLPALLFTLGLFMFVLNGALVYLSILLSPHISMTFLHSMIAGAVIAFINYVVSNIMDFPLGSKPKEA